MLAYDNPQAIEAFRMKSLRGALKLEMLGMKRRGRSVYSIVKEEFGFKGNKQKVLERLEEKIKNAWPLQGGGQPTPCQDNMKKVSATPLTDKLYVVLPTLSSSLWGCYGGVELSTFC